VTSFASERKKQLIEEIGIPAIEINLASKKYISWKAELKELIYSEGVKVKWLYHPEKARAELELKAALDKKIQEANSKIPENVLHDEKSKITSFEKFQNKRLRLWLDIDSRTSRLSSVSKQSDLDAKYRLANERGDRGFYCLNCSHAFHVKKIDLNSLRTVTCPKCDHVVTTLLSKKKDNNYRFNR